MKDTKIQLCASVDRGVFDEVVQIAERESRSVSQTVAILISQAVKERNRKKKSTKNANEQ
jgi:hypothetical protein